MQREAQRSGRQEAAGMGKKEAMMNTHEQFDRSDAAEDAFLRTTIYIPSSLSQELDFIRAKYRMTRSQSIISALDAMLHHAYRCSACNREFYFPDSRDEDYRCPCCAGPLEKQEKLLCFLRP